MKEQVSDKTLYTIIFTVFLDLLGFSILIPIIPFLITIPTSQFYILSPSITLQQAYIIYGFLLASYSIAQFFAAPILGQLSDKYGRKPVLILSLLGTTLSYCIFAYGIYQKDLVILFLARIFDGFTGGNISVAQAAIADITTPKNRAKNFGLVGAAFGLGFIIGPYLGGKLSDTSLGSIFTSYTPFIFAGILSFVNTMMVVKFLPETHTTKNSKKTVDFISSFHQITKAFTMPKLLPLFTASFFFQSGFTFFTNYFALFLEKIYGYNQSGIGEYFGYIGVCIVITQAFITRNIAKKYSEKQVLTWSFFGVALGIALQALSVKGMPGYYPYLVGPIMALSNGLTNANLTGIISKSSEGNTRGEVLGINSSVTALAVSFPPIIAGYISAHINIVSTLYFAALFLVIAGVVFIGNRHKLIS